jgi:hypothetical protein
MEWIPPWDTEAVFVVNIYFSTIIVEEREACDRDAFSLIFIGRVIYGGTVRVND